MAANKNKKNDKKNDKPKQSQGLYNPKTGGVSPPKSTPAENKAIKKKAYEKKKKNAWGNKKVKKKKIDTTRTVPPQLTPEQAIEKTMQEGDSKDQKRGLMENFLYAVIEAQRQINESNARELENKEAAKWSSSARGLGASSIRDADLADIQASENLRRQNIIDDQSLLELNTNAKIKEIDDQADLLNAEWDKIAVKQGNDLSEAQRMADVKKLSAQTKKLMAIKKAARTGDYTGIKREDQRNMLGGKRWVQQPDGSWKVNNKGWKLRNEKYRRPGKVIGETASGERLLRPMQKIGNGPATASKPKPKGPGQNSGGNKKNGKR